MSSKEYRIKFQNTNRTLFYIIKKFGKANKDIYKHNVTTNKRKSTQRELSWRHSLKTSIQDTAATQGSTTATNAQKKLALHYKLCEEKS